MIFFYLLFAHLVSDYLLQPDNLVDWKNHSSLGLVLHSFIHFLFTTLVLYLYTGQLLVVVLALLMAIFHFTIDNLKSAYEQKHKSSLLVYWMDQAAHYLSVFLVTLIAWRFDGVFASRMMYLNNYWDLFFFNPVFITFLSMSIFVTLTIEYSHFRFNPRHDLIHPKLDRKKMIKRLLLATIIYVGLMFALVPSVGFYFGG